MAFRLPTGTTNKPKGPQGGYRGPGTSDGQSGQWNVDTFGKPWFQPNAPPPTSFGAPNVGTGGSAPNLKPMSSYKPDIKPASSYTQPQPAGASAAAKGPSIADLEAKYGRAGYLAAGNAPDTTYTPPAAPAAPGVGGAGGGQAGALGGLAQALEGIEAPMSALSMPAGLREGLGRRQYPTLANALAGLRY